MVKSPFATCISPERVSLFLFFPFFSFNTKKTSYKTRRTVLTIRYLYYILNNTSLDYNSYATFCSVNHDTSFSPNYSRTFLYFRTFPSSRLARLPACTAHQKALSLQIPLPILFVIIQTFDDFFFSTSFWGVLS